MPDLYSSFAQLSLSERQGIDFQVRSLVRNSGVAIIAPHGGKIEPGTSEITLRVAESNFSHYCFEGLRTRPHNELHITSTLFDEPVCLELVRKCQVVLTLHGLAGIEDKVEIGGLDYKLCRLIFEELADVGFQARVVNAGPYAATSRNNICNRGASSMGAQLEITRALRDKLIQNETLLARFASRVRTAIERRLQSD